MRRKNPDRVAGGGVVALPGGLELFPIWRAEIPDLVFHAGGTTSAIGGSLAEIAQIPNAVHPVGETVKMRTALVSS
jgi:hypothetical protein